MKCSIRINGRIRNISRTIPRNNQISVGLVKKKVSNAIVSVVGSIKLE
jgi:hypothetical protein